jgi:Uma2 family endonuclease
VRKGVAVVRTTEYWWWSTAEEKYRYSYRETNRQTYVLVETEKGWLVEENIRPAPRSSTPHRQK